MEILEKIASGIFEAQQDDPIDWDEWKEYASKHPTLQRSVDEIYRCANIILEKIS